MMNKRRLLVMVLLFCCMAGCGRNGENDDADNMGWTKVQEQGDEGSSDRTQAAGEGAETGEAIEGVIAEQSFEVELDDWGTVMFASIAPADGIGGARFVLAKDGAVVYTFPESRTSDEFVEVSAVSFLDYNEDGRKDVIVLTRYRNGTAAWSEADVFCRKTPIICFTWIIRIWLTIAMMHQHRTGRLFTVTVCWKSGCLHKE